jgi:hypothetical protein
METIAKHDGKGGFSLNTTGRAVGDLRTLVKLIEAETLSGARELKARLNLVLDYLDGGRGKPLTMNSTGNSAEDLRWIVQEMKAGRQFAEWEMQARLEYILDLADSEEAERCADFKGIGSCADCSEIDACTIAPA